MDSSAGNGSPKGNVECAAVQAIMKLSLKPGLEKQAPASARSTRCGREDFVLFADDDNWYVPLYLCVLLCVNAGASCLVSAFGPTPRKQGRANSGRGPPHLSSSWAQCGSCHAKGCLHAKDCIYWLHVCPTRT